MTEIAIVGGGLAGATAAALLAGEGRAVHLFEREGAPVDKICGEFLSFEAQRLLRRVGVDPLHLGAAPIDRLRLVSGRSMIEAPLPFVALGLGRRRLDAALLERAEAQGAHVSRGITVRAIRDGMIETTDGALRPDHILLASGKHDVRGAARAASGCTTDYVGFKLHWRLPPRASVVLAGSVDVILFEGGYAGLQRIEGDRANLCLLVTKRRLAELGGNWAGLFPALLAEPHIAAILGDAEPLMARPLTIAGVPYGYLAPSGAHFRLGDQAAVIPSFAGEGMGIALHSAHAAARVLLAGGNATAYQERLRRTVAPRIRLAMGMQRVGASDRLRPLLWSALRFAPGLATLLARLTRVPELPA